MDNIEELEDCGIEELYEEHPIMPSTVPNLDATIEEMARTNPELLARRFKELDEFLEGRMHV